MDVIGWSGESSNKRVAGVLLFLTGDLKKKKVLWGGVAPGMDAVCRANDRVEVRERSGGEASARGSRQSL